MTFGSDQVWFWTKTASNFCGSESPGSAGPMRASVEEVQAEELVVLGIFGCEARAVLAGQWTFVSDGEHRSGSLFGRPGPWHDGA